jgi:hypothetical protein
MLRSCWDIWWWQVRQTDWWQTLHKQNLCIMLLWWPQICTKGKRLHGANKMPYIDRGLACAGQDLTFHKWNLEQVWIYYLSSHKIIAFLFLVLFTRQKASIGEHGEQESCTRDQTHHTKRSHFRRFVLVFFCFFFCIIISCSHARFQKSYSSIFFMLSNFVSICFVASTLKTRQKQATLYRLLVQFSSYICDD